MLKKLVLILMSLILLSFTGCDKNNEKIVIEETLPLADGLSCVKINDLYGFADDKGTIIIEPIYEMPANFKNNMSLVKKNGLWGCIDKTENVIIPFEYEEINYIEDNLLSVKKDGKYGCINLSGDILVDFISFDPITIYKKENVYMIATFNDDQGHEGLVSLTSDLKLEPIYDWALLTQPHDDNIIQLVQNCKHGFVNLATEAVFQPFSSADIYFENGLSVVCVDLKYGYINPNGEYVIPPSYEYAHPFSENRAFVLINGKYGCIDTTGKLVIEPVYDTITPFNSGVATVEADGKTMIIDINGNIQN